MRTLTFATLAMAGAVTFAAPVSAAPAPPNPAVTNAAAAQDGTTEIRYRRNGRNKSYFKRDCMAGYDSAGVRC
jgi:hypothetical protein